MEHKIGEIFEYNGEWYQCVEGNDCANCVFIDYCKSHSKEERDSAIGLCVSFDRNDGMHVIFKKLEKVGEPYEFDGHLFQSYRTFEVPIFTENYATVRELGNNSKISIEIKQNKEDMEEKKIQHYDCFFDKEQSKPNLKPFSLELAKQGKPVCTRDGRKARIICFDAKDTQPIIGLYEKNIDGIVREYLCSYHTDGRMYDDQDTGYDLMMLPEKKEGWAKVRKDINLYDTKEEADRKMIGNDEYVTAKVCWEE